MNEYLMSALRHLKYYDFSKNHNGGISQKKHFDTLSSNDYSLINENSYIMSQLTDYYEDKLFLNDKHLDFFNSFNKTKTDKILKLISGGVFFLSSAFLGWAFGTSLAELILYTSGIKDSYGAFLNVSLVPFFALSVKLSSNRFMISTEKVKKRFKKTDFIKSLNQDIDKINIDMINELQCFKFTKKYEEFSFETEYLINYLSEKDKSICIDKITDNLFHEIYYRRDSSFKNKLLGVPKLNHKLIKLETNI